MNSPERRAKLLALLEEAVASGARLARACDVVGITVRTVQRWRRDGLQAQNVQRPQTRRSGKVTRVAKCAKLASVDL